jgi:hypothetical protein
MTEPEAGRVTCAACGHRSPAGMRFCTRCGAELPIAAQPEPAPAPAPDRTALQATPTVPPAAPPVSARWTLDTPPANESWWRNPIVVAIALVTALGGGGVASWQFFIRSSAPVSSIRRLPPASAPAPGGTRTQPTAPEVDEAAFVGDIERVLRRSSAGLRAARSEHDYGTALENRLALVGELDRLDASGEPAGLARAHVTLREALEASARADRSHLRCACDDTLSEDVAATDLKRRFARQFNPYARQYGTSVVDPDRI